jgi:predicted ATPase
MTGENHHRLLVVIALKTGSAIQESQLVLDMLHVIRDSNECKFFQIEVQPFEQKDTRKLIADMLEIKPGDEKLKEPLDSLASYLLEQTTNVAILADLIEELVRHGLIQRHLNNKSVSKHVDESYDALSYWTWDIDAIKSSRMATDPAQLSIKRFDKLPEETKQVLGLGGIIGTQFDLYTLANAAQLTVEECAVFLRSAYDAGIVSCVGLGVRYLSQLQHCEQGKMLEYDDMARRTQITILSKRVQKCAIEALQADIIAATHHRLGQFYLKSLTNSSAYQHHDIFKIVGHFASAAGGAPREDKEQLPLYLRAAELAAIISCEQASIHFYRMALHLIEEPKEGHWHTQYTTVLYIHQQLAKLQYACGHTVEANALAEQIRQRGTNIADQFSVMSVQVNALLAVMEFDEALLAVSAYLKLLHCNVPVDIHGLEEQQLKLVASFDFDGCIAAINENWVRDDKPPVNQTENAMLLNTLSYLLAIGRASGGVAVELWSSFKILDKLKELDRYHPSIRDALLVLASWYNTKLYDWIFWY